MSIRRTITASALMVFTMICLNYLCHGEDIKPNKPFSTFPKQIGSWTGKERYFDRQVYDKLGVDDSFLSDYATDDGRHLELYVGFYQSQREGDMIHSPRHCMPGAGWNFVEVQKIPIHLEIPHRQDISVNRVLLQKENERQIMFYWYQGRGRYITSEYMQKIYMVFDSLTRRRTDEAFVRIISPVFDGSEEEITHSLHSFTKLLIPILQEYLPS